MWTSLSYLIWQTCHYCHESFFAILNWNHNSSFLIAQIHMDFDSLKINMRLVSFIGPSKFFVVHGNTILLGSLLLCCKLVHLCASLTVVITHHICSSLIVSLDTLHYTLCAKFLVSWHWHLGLSHNLVLIVCLDPFLFSDSAKHATLKLFCMLLISVLQSHDINNICHKKSRLHSPTYKSVGSIIIITFLFI